MSRTILVRHTRLLTMDPSGTVLKDGALYAEDGRIVKVGATEQVQRMATSPEYIVEGGGKVVLPGLVDTHVHLIEAIMRGLVPDHLRLAEWLKEGVWPLQQAIDPDIGSASANLCLLEMLRSGTTSFLEAQLHSKWGIDRIAAALAASGLRGFLSKMVIDNPQYGVAGTRHPFAEDKDASVQEFRRIHAQWNGRAEGKIRVGIGINNPRACSDGLAEEVGRVAAETGCQVTMHLCETRADQEGLAQRNTTPGEFVVKTGLARRNTVFAHGVWLSPRDIELLVEVGASVAHCPSSNAKLASGVAPVVGMLKAGLNVGLGCDGGPSNDAYDLFREMKIAALLQKVVGQDPTVFSYKDALHMATINGARALGLEREVGTIEEGKRADFILVDLKRPHLRPSIGFDSELVYSAHGGDVSHVFVDGEPLLEDGRVQSMDEEKVLEEVDRQANRLVERAASQRR